MAKYNIDLTEAEFFLILNTLYKERNLEVGLTPKFKKFTKIISKFDQKYFKNETCNKKD